MEGDTMEGDTMEEDMVGSLATDGVMAMGSACLATDTGITETLVFK